MPTYPFLRRQPITVYLPRLSEDAVADTDLDLIYRSDDASLRDLAARIGCSVSEARDSLMRLTRLGYLDNFSPRP